MREIVRSQLDNNIQFAAINWDSTTPYNYTILLLQSDDSHDLSLFNQNIEWLYKKWLAGEETAFTETIHTHVWNTQAQPLPTLLNTAEKNEYLGRKAQKLHAQQLSQYTCNALTEKLNALTTTIQNCTDVSLVNELQQQLKTQDALVQTINNQTKALTLQQTLPEACLILPDYLTLKQQLNAAYDALKQIKTNATHANYNTIAPLVEVAYVQSKTDGNFKETRTHLVTLQKQLIATNLERWQKNELMDRLRTAFDNLNNRQDVYYTELDTEREAQTLDLQKQYDLIIPQAVNSPTTEGFELLKNLQLITNKATIQREKRDSFYTQLDEAFTKIKQQADEEQAGNYDLAKQQIKLAITDSKNMDLFKNARAILVDAQTQLRETRLSKKHKDELYTLLRDAFDELNTEQDTYYQQKQKENKDKLADVLQHLKRNLARKQEGIETLYHAKTNIESKTLVIKVDKQSNGSIAAQFNERLTSITTKVADAEKEIEQLQKKIVKMEATLTIINTDNNQN